MFAEIVNLTLNVVAQLQYISVQKAHKMFRNTTASRCLYRPNNGDYSGRIMRRRKKKFTQIGKFAVNGQTIFSNTASVRRFVLENLNLCTICHCHHSCSLIILACKISSKSDYISLNYIDITIFI